VQAFAIEPVMIEIVDYKSEWPAEFERLASRLARPLRRLALRIDHIGSTSVPGLAAKDVIDIQVTVRELTPEVLQCITGAGFRHCPEVTRDHVPAGASDATGDWSKLLFVQPAGERRVHLHVRQAGRPNQRYPLLFRDYLRAQPQVAAAYAELKRRLGAALANAEDYPDVKDPAVDLIYLAAEQWANSTKWQLS
jgi:GrpB-like predicted nucleotidyltransferase (UPF0157 family)